MYLNYLTDPFHFNVIRQICQMAFRENSIGSSEENLRIPLNDKWIAFLKMAIGDVICAYSNFLPFLLL